MSSGDKGVLWHWAARRLAYRTLQWPQHACCFVSHDPCQPGRNESRRKAKRRSPGTSPFSRFATLERPHVFRLPAFGALGHVEFDRLALLKALETACLDRREVHKNIFAVLTANEAVAFGVVEPLHCSLFCHVDTGVPFNRFTLERFGGTEGRLPACWARTAHNRFHLTRLLFYAPCAPFATPTLSAVHDGHDFVGFDVPRDMRSSNAAHLSTRREACSIRRAAVERNSFASARSSSDVGLVCATAFIMSQGCCKSEDQ
jgi:hypothetical protein